MAGLEQWLFLDVFSVHVKTGCALLWIMILFLVFASILTRSFDVVVGLICTFHTKTLSTEHNTELDSSDYDVLHVLLNVLILKKLHLEAA